ncbi:hypothetical protein NE398_11960 [Clostridium tertium]|uniref:Uncharacterized protein n=1 Tax=Clostridium tertium TaxID=1559 RepID=A0A9X3XKG4_9CLOT|nr:hypothetical protein [Clostridium tertium]MDC4240873.1 hypothetical protein [Clostridium tertium]
MNKVFINKETDMVEQILEIREGEIIPDDYFPNCYAIEDMEGNINAYNLKYNKETKEFEVVEGLPAKEAGRVIKQPTLKDFQELKNENENLKVRLEKLEQLLNVR